MARELFKVEKGLSLTGVNSDLGVEVVFGSGAPSMAASIGTLYMDTVSGDHYKKVGAQNTDWLALADTVDIANVLSDAQDYADGLLTSGGFIKKDGTVPMEANLNMTSTVPAHVESIPLGQTLGLSVSGTSVTLNAVPNQAINGASLGLDIMVYDFTQGLVASILYTDVSWTVTATGTALGLSNFSFNIVDPNLVQVSFDSASGDPATYNVTLVDHVNVPTVDTAHKIVGLANGTASGDAVNKGQLDAAVAAEASRAQAAESSLASAIQNIDLSGYLKTDGTIAMGGNLNMGTYKISNMSRGTANTDAVNLEQVVELIDAIPAVDLTAVETAIANETSRALAAEGSLNTSILNEISRAQAAEGSLNTAIVNEISRAQAAESSLNQAILDEASRAQAAESSLSQSITDEASRALAAEGSLNTAILDEASRALAAEGSLNTAILDEVSRAQAAESSLSTAVNGKLSLSGGTMSGAINMDSHKITNLSSGTDPGDAVNFQQLQAATVGLIWLDAVADVDVVGDDVSDPTTITPENGETYLVATGGTGDWSGKVGHLMQWNGTAWVDILGRALTTGDRFGICMEYATTPTGSFSTHDDAIAEITGGSAGAYTYSFHTPVDKDAVFVNAELSQHFGHAYTYTGSLSKWVEFTGHATVLAGVALEYDVNTLNVKHGNGIGLNLSNELVLVLDGSVAATNNLSMGNYKLQNLANGVDASDAVNKGQLDAEASRAQAAESSLATSITNETSRAQAAEGSLATSVANEASRAQVAESSLATAIADETSRALAAEGSLNTAILNETSRALAAESSLSGVIDAETSRALAAESSLNTAILNETSRAQAAESSLATSIANEISRAQAAESSLNGAIIAEESRAQAAESSLSNAITNEMSRAQAAEGSLSGAIIAEESRALAAESSLNTAILNETSRALAAESNLSNGITAEISRALAAESSLNTAILSEESRALAAESSLATSIANEISRALAAESSLNTAVLDETSRAQAAESSLATSIANEISRAQTAEGSLNTAIVDEISRAQAAESSLATSITNEVSRAQAAESSLNTAIVNEVSRALAAESSLNTAIVDEVSRAQAAESSLNTAIVNEVSRALAAESSLNTAILDETSRALAAESSISTGLANETSRALAAESSLATSIANEISRALAAEGSLNTAILNEVSRAQASESSLATSIADEISRALAAEGSLNTAIVNEVSRAQAAESSLATSIANEASRALAAEESLASAIAAIPVTKHVAGPITALAPVDSVSTKTTSAARWFVVARMVDNPNRVKSVEIFAMHDGSNATDATEVDFNQFSKLVIGTDFNVEYDVVLSGSGANQTMILKASTTEASGIKVSATQVWLPDGAI